MSLSLELVKDHGLVSRRYLDPRCVLTVCIVNGTSLEILAGLVAEV